MRTIDSLFMTLIRTTMLAMILFTLVGCDVELATGPEQSDDKEKDSQSKLLMDTKKRIKYISETIAAINSIIVENEENCSNATALVGQYANSIRDEYIKSYREVHSTMKKLTKDSKSEIAKYSMTHGDSAIKGFYGTKLRIAEEWPKECIAELEFQMKRLDWKRGYLH